MSDIKNRIAGLSDEQKKLLTRLLAKENKQKANAEIVPQQKPDGIIPLSFAQERLWYLDQLNPGNVINNMAGYAKVKGNFNIALAKQCFDEIVKRHETLRSNFIEIDGKPRVIVHDSVWDNHTTIDLRNLDSAVRFGKAHELMLNDAKIPFNLSEGRIVRFMWIQTDDFEWIVYIAWHHIISDGISTNVFFQDFIALYEPLTNSKTANYAPLGIQYSDFAIWQREQFEKNWFKGQLGYWNEKLNGVPQLLELPLDFPRPNIMPTEGKRIQIEINKALAEQLKQLSQKEGVTLFVVLLSALNVLLYRYTGQTDIVVGAPIAGRNRNELKNLIGCFLNMLVFRSEFSEHLTFRELLSVVKKTTLEAYDNQDIPFEKLVDELQIERSMSSNPLYQVGFSYEESPVKGVELNNIKLEFAELDINTSRADLMFEIVNEGQELSGWLEYCSALFSKEKMENMAGHLTFILEQIVKNPELSISKIDLLKESDIALILNEWNNTKSDYPAEKCIHQIFEEIVDKYGESKALVYNGKSLSYKALNAKVNQLAWTLKKKGVKKNMPVGLMIEPSLDSITGILAIIKAGGGYLPLDPDYPEERIKFMLQNSGAQLVVAEKRFLKLVGQFAEQVIDINAEENYSDNDKNPVNVNLPSDLLYIMYTSGSTGNPKGVMVEHKNAVRLVKNTNYVNLTDKTRILQTGAPVFDATTFEIWGALLNGGMLALTDKNNLLDSNLLEKELADNEINTLWLSSPLFNQLIQQNNNLFSNLSWLIVGGDVLSPAFINLVRSKNPNLQVVNGYGPTENTTFSVCHQINKDYEHNIPIGKPISNSTAYILDKYMNLLGPGIPGELYLGGDGIARGYVNNDELTSAKFIPNPFNKFEKIYKTGDKAKWTSNGLIEFLGRFDDQVKVRGYRIELGEIEEQLLKHQHIKETLVIAREQKTGEKYICAYFTADISLTINELREFLSKNLPSYMLPSYFLQLPQMPLNVNGKINRKALPLPEEVEMESGIEYESPHNVTEERLTEIWKKFLKQDNIGIHDNYFMIGGDSILSIQIIAEARKEGIFLQPRHFFEHQTIAELSAVAESGSQVASEQGIITGDVNITPIQSYFFNQNFKNINHWNQAVVLELRKPLDKDILKQSIGKLMEHHDALRLRFDMQDEKWHQQMIENESVEILQWVGHADSANQLNAFNMAQQSLNVANGPLLKAVYVDDPSNYRLFMCIHHLAVDGISWRILVEDLQDIYLALSSGKEIALQPKTTSFKKYAEELVKYAANYELTEEVAYWSELKSVKPGNVPLEFGKSENTEGSVNKVSIQLDEEHTKFLLNEANTAYNTKINDLLLAALANPLSNLTQQKNNMVSLEGHGRQETIENIDLTRTVGWFTTIYPVLLSAPEDNSVEKLVKNSKETLRKVPENGFNYGVLKYLSANVAAKNSLSAIPSPQVSFNYLGQLDRHENSDDLFILKNEDTGLLRGADNQRTHLIDINAYVINHKMHFDFDYSVNINKAATIQQFANDYIQALYSIIRHCTDKNTVSYTPSDFSEVELSQDELDNILNEII